MGLDTTWRSAYITIVSLVSIAVTLFVFYFCFDSFLKKRNRDRRRDEASGGYTILYNFKSSVGKTLTFAPGIERFVYEQFESALHEVVCVILSDEKKCVSIAAFLQERKVEYFSETFPPCCTRDINGKVHTARTKAAFAALYAWGTQWTLANSVVFLVDDRGFVEKADDSNDIIGEKVDHFEEKHDFKLTCHWTENYICDVVSIT